MARVNAKKHDPIAQQEKLERTIRSTKDRLVKLNEKYQLKVTSQEVDQQDRLQSQINQTELRLQESEQQLAAIIAKNSNKIPTEHQEEQVNEQTTAKPVLQDAASSAIEKAKANTAALASMSEEEKKQQQIDSLQQRLTKAKKRLQNAQQENSEHIDAFTNAVVKIESKLNELTQ